MTAAERQQRKRDRLKAGLVLVQEWVPADQACAARDALRRIVADATLRGDWEKDYTDPKRAGWRKKLAAMKNMEQNRHGT